MAAPAEVKEALIYRARIVIVALKVVDGTAHLVQELALVGVRIANVVSAGILVIAVRV